MDINNFIIKRPFLYHLTCKENAEAIIENEVLYSANELIRQSGKKEYEEIRRRCRKVHEPIKISNKTFWLRDQKPISLVNLAKCLTGNWTVEDFLYHLNDRVFMWPTISRLSSHFERYKFEKPVILRLSTEELLKANPHARFCRLNSGATRSNSHLNGAPPDRGANTFWTAKEYPFPIGSVAEVTFETTCKIVGPLSYGSKPEGRFIKTR